MHLSLGTEPIPFTRGHRVIHEKPQTFFLNDFFHAIYVLGILRSIMNL